MRHKHPARQPDCGPDPPVHPGEGRRWAGGRGSNGCSACGRVSQGSRAFAATPGTRPGKHDTTHHPLLPVPSPRQISHDNALDSLPYELVMGVLGNKSQANGCNVSVTWFAMFYHSGEPSPCAGAGAGPCPSAGTKAADSGAARGHGTC